MRPPTAEYIIGVIESRFTISSIDRQPDIIRFGITDSDYEERFAGLARFLEERGMVAVLERSDGTLMLSVQRLPPARPRRFLSSAWLPRILFCIVVSFVMVDGYYRTIGINELVYIGEPWTMAVIYTVSLLGILGVHEAGHMVASRIHRLKTSWPYFIPGIPVFGFVPTFGAVIKAKGLTINRRILYDVAMAGPVAGLIIAIIVTIYGVHTAPEFSPDEITELGEAGVLESWKSGVPLMMSAIMTALGKGVGDADILITPVLFAAWIGYLITFLNLLPASQLDGGHMARTFLGTKLHRIATYASMGVLVLLGYWLMAVFILALSARNPSAQILDDVSPLTTYRKISYGAIVIMAILCAPLPEWLSP